MEIKTKYNLGDKIFFNCIGSLEYVRQCKKCNGDGYYRHKDTLVKCTYCDYGSVPMIRSYYKPAQGIIEQIQLALQPDGNIRTSYYVNQVNTCSHTLCDSNEVFDTEEDAQKYCNTINAKITKDLMKALDEAPAPF